MKIKEGFMLREVAGSFVVIAVGDASVNFNGMITINDSAAFLWKMLEKGAEKQELIDALLAEFDVDESTATADVTAFIEKLASSQLLAD